jgi:hypothetical protein
MVELGQNVDLNADAPGGGGVPAAAQPPLQVVVQNRPYVTVAPFSGSEKENFEQFQRQLGSAILIGDVPVAQRVRFLHLHLTGGALLFFDQLQDDDTATIALATTALRARYANPQRHELHKLAFTTRKFMPSKENVEDYLTELNRLAALAYPELLHGDDRAAERTSRIRETFIEGMPNRIKRSLYQAPEADGPEELCERAARKLLLDSICPSSSVRVTPLNEISERQCSSSTNDAILAALKSLNAKFDGIKAENPEFFQKIR